MEIIIVNTSEKEETDLIKVYSETDKEQKMEIKKVYSEMYKVLQQHMGNVIKQKCEAEAIVHNANELLDMIVEARVFLDSFDPLKNEDQTEGMKKVIELLKNLEEGKTKLNEMKDWL